MNPKYIIGELVIIDCPQLPEFHGTEHVVTEIAEVTFEQHNNKVLLCYTLDFTYEWQGVKDYKYWAEWSLRKKHEPGEMDYKELMQTLKNSVLEWN